MRKTTIYLSSAAAALLAFGIANAELAPVSRFNVNTERRTIPSGYRQMDVNGEFMAAENVAGPAEAYSTSQTTTVLYEDFSNVPNGEFVQTGKIGLRAVTPIANYDCGKYMNPAYTPNSGQWYGEWVYAGTDGTVIIQCYNPQAGAELCMPLGDYSGDLIVTMRVRSAKTFWGADTECGYVTSAGGGCDVNLMACIGGYGNHDRAKSDLGGNGYSFAKIAKLYEEDGWTEVRTTLRNESANSDGYLCIYLSDACEIDWIKVEDAGTHLAAPVAEGLTDFQEDSFTVKWGKMRRPFNYYIDLWYANWLAESGVDENYGFENGIPTGFTAGGATAAPGEGYESSNGIRIAAGADNAFATPEFQTLLKSGELRFSCVSPDGTFDEAPTLVIEGLSEEGWRTISEQEIDGFWTAANRFYRGQLKGDNFADNYKALRFYSKNTDDETYFVIDNLVCYAPRPYRLDRVVDTDESHGHNQVDLEYYRPYIEAGYLTEEEALEAIESPFNRWWNTEHKDPCAYTFNDCIEPDKEYYYRIRSHRLENDSRGNTFSAGEIQHAFGVAAPQLKAAKDVKEDSYTAAWKDAAKAQNFIVSNYKAETMAEDEAGKVIFSEAFSNIDGNVGYSSYEPATGNLDTDMPGWTGEDLTYGYQGIGAGQYGMVISPEIGVVPNGNTYYVYFEAEGMTGESLVIQFNKLEAYLILPFEDESCAATLQCNIPMEGESISFYTYNGYPFALKGLEITQDVKKGDLVRTFQSAQVVPAGVEQAVFTGLDKESDYAFKVVSHYKLEQKAVRSMPNGRYNIVNLKNGETTEFSKIEELDADVTVVARYTVDGLAAPEGYKGLVIEKLSNGKTRKAIIR